eukprot:scaffold228728_cov32-Tisochrysis_lutea.AAC.2
MHLIVLQHLQQGGHNAGVATEQAAKQQVWNSDEISGRSHHGRSRCLEALLTSAPKAFVCALATRSDVAGKDGK